MHPIVFRVPGIEFDLYSYGVMLGISMILGWNIVMYFGKREAYYPNPKVNEDFLANAFIFCVACAVLGARVLYFITVPDDFTSIIDVVNLRRGGLVAYGGFLGGFFGAIFWVKMRHGVALLRFSDGAAPALALGLSITRIGCYLYGCDFGGRLSDDAPGWLRTLGTFPHWHSDQGSPAWSHHVQVYDLPYDAPASFPVHPTQLYESLAGLVLFTLCILVWKRRTFHGQVLLTLAMAYGLWRFAIEFVRDDPGRGAAFGFSTSQLISLAIVPVAAFFYMSERKMQQVKPRKVIQFDAPVPVFTETLPKEKSAS